MTHIIFLPTKNKYTTFERHLDWYIIAYTSLHCFLNPLDLCYGQSASFEEKEADLVVTKPGSTSQLAGGIDDYSLLVVKKSDWPN